MSLSYKLAKIENFEALLIRGKLDENDSFVPDAEGDTTRLTPMVESLVWISMLAGFNKITKDNWPQIFVRIAMVETCIGPYRSSPEGGVYFKPEEIKRCVGLETNAAAMTPKQFDAYAIRMLRRPCEDAIKKYLVDQELKNESQDAVETEAEATPTVQDVSPT